MPAARRALRGAAGMTDRSCSLERMVRRCDLGWKLGTGQAERGEAAARGRSLRWKATSHTGRPRLGAEVTHERTASCRK